MKKNILLFTLLLAIMTPATTAAYDLYYHGIYYSIYGDEATVTFKEFPGYNGHGVYTGNVTIPDSIPDFGKTYPVTAIGYAAFYGCDELTGITIPNTVRFIGDHAFYGCSGLQSIILPNSIKTISGLAFYNCSELSSITFPNSVISVGEGAFHNTAWYNIQPEGLVYTGSVVYKYKGTMPAGTSITIVEGTLGIASHAFADCSGLTSVTIPNSVAVIGYAAFSDCSGLTSIEIPNSVTTIGLAAFDGCSGLTSVDIGNSVSSFGESAFCGCERLTRVNITDLASWCNVDFNFDETNHFTSNPLYYAHHLYLNGEEVKDLVIPNSVTSISHAAFYKCSGLTSVTFPVGVTEISYMAFNDCDSLQTVTCLGTVPPVMVDNECFSMVAYNNAKLLVPRQSIDTYQATNYWYKFTNIEGYGSAGLGDVDADGFVGIYDVTVLIDTLLSGNQEAISFDSADLNANGLIDIDDVTTLIDMLLSGN